MTEIRDNFGELQRLRNDEDAQKLDVMQVRFKIAAALLLSIQHRRCDGAAPTVPPHTIPSQIMSQLYVQTSNVKISGVKDYIDGMCNTGAKFLVFAYHVDMLKAIESVVVKNKVSVKSSPRNVRDWPTQK